MKFTDLRCTRCNGTLRLDIENPKKAICEYCAEQYSLEWNGSDVGIVGGKDTKKNTSNNRKNTAQKDTWYHPKSEETNKRATNKRTTNKRATSKRAKETAWSSSERSTQERRNHQEEFKKRTKKSVIAIIILLCILCISLTLYVMLTIFEHVEPIREPDFPSYTWEGDLDNDYGKQAEPDSPLPESTLIEGTLGEAISIIFGKPIEDVSEAELE